ncbi:hypothetical protein [Niallia taxi]|uniref:hypothetical protein n=1 Tax=Niallia taxi TaxID=2499688 RepID=UPI0015F45612|nr:hypothetical protein [Niallia taxi]
MQFEWEKDNLMKPLFTMFIYIPIILSLLMIPLGIVGYFVESFTSVNAWTILKNVYGTGIHFLLEHALSIAVLFICAYFSRNKMFYYRTLEVIRRQEFEMELKRYDSTPYVPYLLSQYLLNPPSGFYTRKNAKFEETYTFYRHIVSYFRSQIYQSKGGESVGPKYSYKDVVKPNIVMITGALSITALTLLSIQVKYGLVEFWINSYDGYGKFAFVPLYVLTGWGFSQLLAVLRYPKLSYIFSVKEDEVSNLLWEEVLPGTYYAEWMEDVNKEYQRNLIDLYGQQAAGAMPCYPQDLYPSEMPKNIFYPVPGMNDVVANVGSTTWNEKEAKILHKEKSIKYVNKEKKDKVQVSLKQKEKKKPSRNGNNVVDFAKAAKRK